MLNQDCSELEWENFFDEHDWIFGGINEIQILGKITKQPIVSGSSVFGKGEKKGDFMLNTKGAISFTIPIEIKRADTALLKSKCYREGIFKISSDLNGGVAQLRAYLRKWHLVSSRTDENRDLLEAKGIYTIQPKGILIIGNLKQLDDRSKKECFELFRQNQKDIHIITYDEVYERMNYLFGV